MKSLQFVTEENPEQYPLQAEAYLYNSEPYLAMKKDRFGQPITFYALDENIALASIHFFMVENEWREKDAVSLAESPFGSFEYIDGLDAESLMAFVAYIKTCLERLDVKKILIKDCINAYRTHTKTLLPNVLQQSGFQEASSLMNHHIQVDECNLEVKMHKMERKRLRKSRRLGMKFLEEPLSSLPYYYHFLQKCRQEKGWSLSLSYEDIMESVQQMPEHYRIFAVYRDDQCLAASLSVVVNERILYDFYHDSKAAYSAWSPVVFLVEGIYQYCQKQQFRILDLGTSQTQSLQQFKQNLGGIASYKYTYQLHL